MIEENLTAINTFFVQDDIYVFNEVGNYDISFSVMDAADNSTTYVLTIIVSEPTVNWAGFNNYYLSLNSSSDVVGDLAVLLRNTVDYVSYGDARYVYTVDEFGKQVILYDIPTSDSYGNVTAEGLNGWGDGGNIVGDGFSITINREHVWACNDMQIMPSNKDRTLSDGYVPFVANDGSFDYRPDNTNLGHYSDLHNLWNALASPNSTHSDHFYGEENGNSVTPYLMNNIFYPGDEYRGDIARILFYMTLMYPHLTLVNTGDANAVEGSIYYGYLDVLLLWNEEDPVSSYEITRNETIYLEQGNRNPFIDYYHDDIIDVIFADGDPNILD